MKDIAKEFKDWAKDYTDNFTETALRQQEKDLVCCSFYKDCVFFNKLKAIEKICKEAPAIDTELSLRILEVTE